MTRRRAFPAWQGTPRGPMGCTKETGHPFFLTLQKSGPPHHTGQFPDACPVSPAPSPVEMGASMHLRPESIQPTALPPPRVDTTSSPVAHSRASLSFKRSISAHLHLLLARSLVLGLPPPTRSGPAEYPTALPLTKEPTADPSPALSVSNSPPSRHPINR